MPKCQRCGLRQPGNTRATTCQRCALQRRTSGRPRSPQSTKARLPGSGTAFETAKASTRKLSTAKLMEAAPHPAAEEQLACRVYRYPNSIAPPELEKSAPPFALTSIHVSVSSRCHVKGLKMELTNTVKSVLAALKTLPPCRITGRIDPVEPLEKTVFKPRTSMAKSRKSSAPCTDGCQTCAV